MGIRENWFYGFAVPFEPREFFSESNPPERETRSENVALLKIVYL